MSGSDLLSAAAARHGAVRHADMLYIAARQGGSGTHATSNWAAIGDTVAPVTTRRVEDLLDPAHRDEICVGERKCSTRIVMSKIAVAE